MRALQRRHRATPADVARALTTGGRDLTPAGDIRQLTIVPISNQSELGKLQAAGNYSNPPTSGYRPPPQSGYAPPPGYPPPMQPGYPMGTTGSGAPYRP